MSQGIVVSPNTVFCVQRKKTFELPQIQGVATGDWVDLEWAGSAEVERVVSCRSTRRNVPDVSVDGGTISVRTCVVFPSESEAESIPDGYSLAWSPLLGRICVHGLFGERFDVGGHPSNDVYEQSATWLPSLAPRVSAWVLLDQPVSSTPHSHPHTVRGAPWLPSPPSMVDTAVDTHSPRATDEREVYVGLVIGSLDDVRFVWAAGAKCILLPHLHDNVPDVGGVVNVTLSRQDRDRLCCVYRVDDWWPAPDRSILGIVEHSGQRITVKTCIVNAWMESVVDGESVLSVSHAFFGRIVDDRKICPRLSSSSHPAMRVLLARTRRWNWCVSQYFGGASVDSIASADNLLIPSPLSRLPSQPAGSVMVRARSGDDPSTQQQPAVVCASEPRPSDVFVGVVCGCLDGLRYVWAAGRLCIVYPDNPHGLPAIGDVLHVNISRLGRRKPKCEFRVDRWRKADVHVGTVHIRHNIVMVTTTVQNSPRRTMLDAQPVIALSHPFYGLIVDSRRMTERLSGTSIQVTIRRQKHKWYVCGCAETGASDAAGPVSGDALPVAWPRLEEEKKEEEGRGCEAPSAYTGFVQFVDKNGGGTIHCLELNCDVRFQPDQMTPRGYCLGAWVRFDGVRKARLRSGHELSYLDGSIHETAPVLPTRIERRLPEVECVCLHSGRLSPRGLFLLSSPLGDVVDHHRIITPSSPLGAYRVWVVHQKEEDGVKWKISIVEEEARWEGSVEESVARREGEMGQTRGDYVLNMEEEREEEEEETQRTEELMCRIDSLFSDMLSHATVRAELKRAGLLHKLTHHIDM